MDFQKGGRMGYLMDFFNGIWLSIGWQFILGKPIIGIFFGFLIFCLSVYIFSVGWEDGGDPYGVSTGLVPVFFGLIILVIGCTNVWFFSNLLFPGLTPKGLIFFTIAMEGFFSLILWTLLRYRRKIWH